MTRFSFGVDARTLAALAVLHVAMIAIVDPRGEFPVNDDWAYFRAVEWWFAEGRIRLPEWVGMNLATQTLAGAAVAGVFALKFETLRHLTQAVALAAIFGAYALFRALALERRDAFVATAAVIAFPPWAVLANSYMTDLYGLVFALPAAVLYVRALESPSRRMVVVATLLAIAGTLQRQVVLVIPFAYMAASLWSRPARSPRTIATAIAPFALTLGCEFAYHAYLALGPGIPIGQTVAHGRLLPMALKALANDENTAVLVLWNAAGIVGYLGLFAAGWIVWCIAGAPTRTRGLVIAGGVAVAALAFAAEWFPPYRADSVLDRAGIGPILFYEPLLRGMPLDRSPGVFWKAVAIPTALGMAAVMALFAQGVLRALQRPRDAVLTFLLVVIGAYLGPFVLSDYIDRYLLFILPFLFALCARLWPTRPSMWRVAGAAWISAALGLSVAATHDYFAWNRVRWDALRLAEAMGGNGRTIDGGFEYNALRNYERGVGRNQNGKSWWWVEDDQYIVGLAIPVGYEVVRMFPVKHWLPRSPSAILVLRRKSG